MFKASVLAAAMLATMSQAAMADTIYWPAMAATANAREKVAYFPMGTALKLTTRTQLSTKDNHPGDRFYLEVAEALSYHGQTILPVGSVAVGEVVRADRNGHMGKKGKLDVRLLYIETPYGQVHLSGRSNKEGKSGTLVAVGGVLFVSTLFYFVHGTSGTIAADTPVTAYLAEDLRFPDRAPAMQQAGTRVVPDQVSAARIDSSAVAANQR
jgi:hypothetical protein